MERAARLHYDHGMPHHEVASILGVSRVKVTRLLGEARRIGVVEIVVHGTERPFADLEQALADRYSLSSVWIAPDERREEEGIDALGLVGSQCLTDLLTDVSVVAVGTSTTVARAVAQLPERGSGTTEFVPLSGSLSGLANTGNPHTLAYQMARRLNGVAYNLPAPLVAADEAGAASLQADSSVSEVLSRAARADVLVAGIGGTGRSTGQLASALSEDVLSEIRSAGAVGDLSARFFDAEGRSLHTSLDRRIVGLTLEEIRRIPERIGIAAGEGKCAAIAVALKSQLISCLVTDISTARQLLGD